MKNRVLSILLALVLTIGMIPSMVFAVNTAELPVAMQVHTDNTADVDDVIIESEDSAPIAVVESNPAVASEQTPDIITKAPAIEEVKGAAASEDTKVTEKNVSIDVTPDEGYVNLFEHIDEEQYKNVRIYSASDTDRVDPLDPERIKLSGSADFVAVYTSDENSTVEQECNIDLSIADNEIGVDNQKAPGQVVSESKYRLSWKSTVTGSIEVSFIPSEEISNHRLGAVYAVSNNGGEEAEAKSILESYVEQLNAGTKTTSDLESVLNEVSYTTNVRVYALEDKLARWDSESASYCYYYNVTVKPEKSRTVMMYAIYYDIESEEYRVVYSDFVEQTAPAADRMQ